jgi:FecR protein
MHDRSTRARGTQVFGILLSLCICSAAFAQDAAWRVSKSSGAVWVIATGAQQASLSDTSELRPGDSIRTGRNGRALLVRGEETLLIAPNSVVGLPTEQKDGLSTTIIEQAGSILIQAEKRNVKHFQVETPYLAAVVKGTEFRVSVSERGAAVEVLGGQVEVTDFKSGQYALVLPGQNARVSALGSGGLSVRGAGTLGPVQNGNPRAQPVQPVPVPKGGLSAPRKAQNGQTVHALADLRNMHAIAGGPLRINSALGELHLNIGKVTDGLARAANLSSGAVSSANQQTIWSNGALVPGNGASKAYDSNTSNSGAGNSNGHANGNGSGNGNGNANGAANSAAVGNGNANDNGNGNGKANGHSKGKKA